MGKILFFCPKFQSYLDPLGKKSIVKAEDKQEEHEKLKT